MKRRLIGRLIGIRFIPIHGEADLEVIVPTDEGAEGSVRRTLAGLGIQVKSSYLVRAGERLIVRAKLSEQGGTPVSPSRASEVLIALRVALTPRLATVSPLPSPREPAPGREFVPAA